MSTRTTKGVDFTKTAKHPPHAAKVGRTANVRPHAAELVQRKEQAAPVVQPMTRATSRVRPSILRHVRASSSSASRHAHTRVIRAEVPKSTLLMPWHRAQARKWLDKIERGEDLEGAQQFFEFLGIEVPRVEVGPTQHIWEVRNAGGGAKGPLLLPVKQALDERGIHPVSYTGSSVGTIPSLLAALGMTHEEMMFAMGEFTNVLNMPHWEKWRDEDLAVPIDDGPDGGGAGLAHLIGSAAHTGIALWKQGGRLSDRARLHSLVREIVGSQIRRGGFSGLFADAYNPKLGELAAAVFSEPESPLGLLSFPVTDSLTSRLIRVDPFTMPRVPILDAVMGATAHPLLFTPYMVNGRLVWDGGAAQNVGFPGFFGPLESISTNFVPIDRERGGRNRRFPTGLLQIGTKATGLPFQLQHAIDDYAWEQGAFGAPVPVVFDPKRISTTMEASADDVRDMSPRVYRDALSIIGRYARTDPKARIQVIEALRRWYTE